MSEMIRCSRRSSWNSDAYKEYYVVATGATPPKTKASIRKTKSSFDTTVTPPPIAAAGTRMFTSAKGKQPATTSKAKSLTALSEVAMTEAQQLKLATKRSMHQTHISQASGSGADEGTGLQISQSPRDIFINQSKYALESLQKYGFESCDLVDTSMVEKSKLDKDKEGKAVDPSHYRGMIGTLLYLTASRPDLQFAICMCARYQARPTKKHVHAVKRIFRYLRVTVHQGLWYPKDCSVALTAFADANHVGCQDTRRSTSGSVQFLGERLISWSSKRQKSVAISGTKAEYITLSGCCAQILWMRSQLSDYGLGFKKITMHGLLSDHAKACVYFATQPVLSIFQRTMDTTIEQQAAMDEALVPHAQRLRIGRSNFRLLSDIKSKESTMQLVYDATTTVHHHAIRFKMDNKKHIVNLESFRDMLHICSRVHGQSFAEPSFEEEILAFIRFLGHSAAIKMLTDVEHKNTKKSNEMYYPRFTKVIIHHFMSKDSSIPRRNKSGALLPIELTNDEIRNSNAYKEYYAIATGAAPPSPKASARRTRSSFDTSITPPTAAVSPRMTASAKGKQTAKASKAKSLSALSEVAMTEVQQLKLVTKRSMQQTHISQASGFGADEGTSSIPGIPDAPTDEFEEELSWNSTDDEGADDEEKDGDDVEEDEGDDDQEGNGDDDDEDDDGEKGDDDDAD
uniref:Uncharacterized mitochondrial protein AtMg00810-like n=1 Tax=Tanacetum cinerariifolium TaxID=118510 RepID=A0A699IDR8_TANCI|nr:uncharacterized mitochondrial protein AtMg00810-like [Tanacetum cinerariifolium]